MKEIIKRYQATLPCLHFIVTGSYVINLLMGIPEGKVGDLDVILVDPTDEAVLTLKRLQEAFSPELKSNPNYPVDLIRIMDNKVKVDFFLQKDVTRPFITLEDGTKVSPILNIVSAKKGYNRPKDWFQLRKLARMFFKEEEFIKYMDNNG